MTNRVLVCGAGGFIGNHVVRRLKGEGYWVRGVDLRRPEFSDSDADEFVIVDLRDRRLCQEVCDGRFDEAYQLASDMGGAGYIFTGVHDGSIMSNSATINLNVLTSCVESSIPRIFFSSSACIYPEYNQRDPEKPVCAEDSVYPAMPDSEYGWEKLFSERLYLAHHRARKIEVRIGRLHNVYGPENPWRGGREKAPAAICRKIAAAANGGEVEIWGDGRQTRSFLHVDDCVDAIRALMRSTCSGPMNIGSEEMVTITGLVEMVAEIAGKQLTLKYVPGPQGVRGRTSDNRLIRTELGWRPVLSLRDGMARTYAWIQEQVTRGPDVNPNTKGPRRHVL